MSRILQEIGFCHLHVHSSYSLLEGALKIGDLAKLAAADRQPALALTDTNNLFGALEFSEKLAGMGIQPIAGIQLSVCFEGPDPTQRAAPASANVVLLAQSEEGYRNLMRLASRAYFDVPLGDMPRIVAPVLADHREGLIALTGGFTGPLDTALRHGGRRDLATARLEFLHQTFGDRLYVEIQRHGLDEERLVEGELIAMADAAGMPLVATNEPFFAEPADYEAHDALLAIAEGCASLGREAAASLARARLQDAPGDDGAVQGPARRASGQRRDRDALRLPGAHPQADPAQLRRQASRPPPSTRRRSCNGRPRRGSRGASPPTGPRPA